MGDSRREDLRWISLLGPGPQKFGWWGGTDVREPLPDVEWLDASEGRPLVVTEEVVETALRVRALLLEVADLVNRLGGITSTMPDHPDARPIASSLGDIRATVLDTLSALAMEADPKRQVYWRHREQRIAIGRADLMAALVEVEALGCTPDSLPLIKSASHSVSGLYEDMLK